MVAAFKQSRRKQLKSIKAKLANVSMAMRARKADCAVAISLAFEGLAGDPKQKIIKKNKKLKTSRNCCVTTSTTDQAQKADKEYSGTYGNG